MIAKRVKNYPLRSLAGAAIALSAVAIAGQSVLASLNATVFNSPQNVNSGTMTLNLADAGAGFSSSIANLAPGDVVNRYVTLTNTGSLDGIDLSLQVAATGSPNLISDGVTPSTTKALRLTVTSCSQVWSAGVCGGTQITEISERALSTLSSSVNFFDPIMNSGSLKYLQMKLQLPDQNETTTNGNPPTSTVQGGTVNVTYNFDLAQRLATTTNS
jgi:hypothetical protein